MSLSVQNRSVVSASSPLPRSSEGSSPSRSPRGRQASHFAQDGFSDAVPERSSQLLGTSRNATASVAANGLTVPQRELDFGDSRPDVLHLQQCLVALGFMGQDQLHSGPGTFGFITQQAVKEALGQGSHQTHRRRRIRAQLRSSHQATRLGGGCLTGPCHPSLSFNHIHRGGHSIPPVGWNMPEPEILLPDEDSV